MAKRVRRNKMNMATVNLETLNLINNSEKILAKLQEDFKALPVVINYNEVKSAMLKGSKEFDYSDFVKISDEYTIARKDYEAKVAPIKEEVKNALKPYGGKNDPLYMAYKGGIATRREYAEQINKALVELGAVQNDLDKSLKYIETDLVWLIETKIGSTSKMGEFSANTFRKRFFKALSLALGEVVNSFAFDESGDFITRIGTEFNFEEHYTLKF